VPTTKRIRRHARPIQGIQPGGTRWQILIWGNEVVPMGGEAFKTVQEERAAWRANRADLMREFDEPGSRPAAYFKFELKTEPGKWSMELGALLDRQLVGPEEALRIESLRPILAVDAERFYAIFDDLALKPASFRVDPSMGEECAMAARWHDWRGRPDLAGIFRRRAQVVRDYERSVK
jgi:hypothetical protein